MSKVIFVVLLLSLSYLANCAPATAAANNACSNNLTSNENINNKTRQFYCASSKLKNIIVELSESRVAVAIDSLRDKLSLCEINATCEIYVAAVLLKTKLMHFMYYNETKISANVIRLFQSALSYLDSIADIQLQIYEEIPIDCKNFFNGRYMNDYHIWIEIDVDSMDFDPNDKKYIFSSWLDYQKYSNNYCLPAVAPHQCNLNITTL